MTALLIFTIDYLVAWGLLKLLRRLCKCHGPKGQEGSHGIV